MNVFSDWLAVAAAFVAGLICSTAHLAVTDDTWKPCNSQEIARKSTKHLIEFDLQKRACAMGYKSAAYK